MRHPLVPPVTGVPCRSRNAHGRVGLVLLLMLAGLSCRKADESAPPAPGEDFRVHRVPQSPLAIGLPPDWTLDPVDPPPVQTGDATDTAKGEAVRAGAAPKAASSAEEASTGDARALALQSRLLFSARAPTGARGEAGRPWLMVLQDPNLPADTTSSLYLQAQRASNRAVARLEHVEAEHTERQGRFGYWLRDAFELPLGETEVAMSQQSLLLLDAPGEHLVGYAIVLTALEEDRARHEALFRAILSSVAFPDG